MEIFDIQQLNIIKKELKKLQLKGLNREFGFKNNINYNFKKYNSYIFKYKNKTIEYELDCYIDFKRLFAINYYLFNKLQFSFQYNENYYIEKIIKQYNKYLVDKYINLYDCYKLIKTNELFQYKYENNKLYEKTLFSFKIKKIYHYLKNILIIYLYGRYTNIKIVIYNKNKKIYLMKRNEKNKKSNRKFILNYRLLFHTF